MNSRENNWQCPYCCNHGLYCDSATVSHLLGWCNSLLPPLPNGRVVPASLGETCTLPVSEEASQMRMSADLTVGQVVLVKNFSQFFSLILLFPFTLLCTALNNNSPHLQNFTIRVMHSFKLICGSL